MGIKKCVPKNIKLTCDKGANSCPLIVINPKTTIHGVDIATEADKVFGTNFIGFGKCSVTGSACAAAVSNWKYTTESSLVCSGNKLLTNESELPCSVGGIITVDLDAPSNEIDAPNVFDRMQAKMNGMVDKVTAPIKELESAANEALSGVKDSINELGKKANDAFSDVLRSGQEFADLDAIDKFGKTVDGFGNVLEKSKEGWEMIGDLTGTRNEIDLGIDIVEGVGRTGLSIADKLGKGVTSIFDYGKEYWNDPSARFEKDKQIAKAVGTAAVDGAGKIYDETKLLATDLMEDTPGTIKNRHASLVNYTSHKIENAVAYKDWYMNEATDQERADATASGAIKFVATGVGGGITKGVSTVVGAATKKAIGATGQAVQATVNQVSNKLGQLSETVKGIKQVGKKDGDVITKGKSKADQKKAEKEAAEKEAAEEKSSSDVPPEKMKGKRPSKPMYPVTDKDGNLTEYGKWYYDRPAWRKDTITDTWENAKDSEGKVWDRVSKKEITWSDDKTRGEQWHMGHKEGHEFRKHQKSAAKRGIGVNQFRDEYNNAKHIEPELPSSNLSHKGEAKDDVYFGP